MLYGIGRILLIHSACSSLLLAPHFFFLIFLTLYWSVVYLQCSVSVGCTAEVQLYVYPFPDSFLM